MLFKKNNSPPTLNSLLEQDTVTKMPTPGYVFRDSGTTPSVELDNPIGTIKAPPSSLSQKSAGLSPSAKSSFQQKPTHSHTLATIDQETKGAAQHAGKEDSITNLGWQANGKDVATLVGGLSNGDLWTLIRRFNKVSRNR